MLDKMLTSKKKPIEQPEKRFSEAVVRRCFSKQVFLNIWQISPENTYVGICNFIKKRLQHRYFPVKFTNF